MKAPVCVMEKQVNWNILRKISFLTLLRVKHGEKRGTV